MVGRLGRILLYSLFGALGASVSGALIYWGLIPLMQAGALGLYLALVQGLVFSPLGISLGLSAMLCMGAIGPPRNAVIVHAGIGGTLLGVLSFFSIGGSILGLILLGVSISVGVGRAMDSIRLAALQGLVFLLLTAMLIMLLRSGDWAFVPAMSVFDPLRTINAVGFQSMGWLVLAGYILNFGVLVALWEKVR